MHFVSSVSRKVDTFLFEHKIIVTYCDPSTICRSDSCTKLNYSQVTWKRVTLELVTLWTFGIKEVIKYNVLQYTRKNP
jgi:hypothetical protein